MDKGEKLYRYFYRTHRDDDCAGVVRAASDNDARIIAARHLKCNESQVKIEPIKFSEDGFCEVYYG